MNFDEIIDRNGTNSVKYDDLKSKFGVDDILPLWVADMDFATSPAIIEVIKNRLNHPIFGYSFYATAYFDAIKGWYHARHDWQISGEQIIPVNNIASAVAVALEKFSNIGDGILIQIPLYPPFRESIIRHDRIVVENRLRLIEGRYEIDWEDFTLKAKQTKIFLFCSPHNPTGRVWRRDELTKMSQICHENGVLIVSDEIHSDLTHDGYKHIQIASLKNKNIITLNSPAKRFNIPSIINAYAIIKEENLREQFINGVARYAPHTPSPLLQDITIAAYEDSSKWISDVDKYLANNLKYILDEIKKTPQIKAIAPEASFLLWLDCRALKLSSDELTHLFANKLKLGLNNGVDFGANGDGFMRLNYAVPRSILIDAMDRLKFISKGASCH